MYTYDSNTSTTLGSGTITSTTLGSGTIPYSAIKEDRISFISSHPLSSYTLWTNPLWTPAKKGNVFLRLFRRLAERF